MPKKAKPNFGNVKSGGSTTAPVPTPKRIPGHATKPSYGRNKLEKIVDDVGKAIRRVPSDIRGAKDVIGSAAQNVKGKIDKLRKK